MLREKENCHRHENKEVVNWKTSLFNRISTIWDNMRRAEGNKHIFICCSTGQFFFLNLESHCGFISLCHEFISGKITRKC